MKPGSSFTLELFSRRACGAMALGCALFFSIPATLGAQGVLLQGIADLEAWSTDTSSNLLTRNDGKAGLVVRLQMWTAAELLRNVVVYAQAAAEGGSASTAEEKFKPELYQLAARYSPSAMFVVDAGKISHPMSIFAARRFSTRNPLIGSPDGYTQQYPLAVQLSGSTLHFDYRLAGSSLPLSHDGYLPPPGEAWRPAIAAGVTPFIGFRVGASTTWGPYLSDGFSALQLRSKSWKSYHQRILATDVEFSKGYFELRGEWSHSSFDVPGHSDATTGFDAYVEGKYTINPRFFVAARAERNNYPFIASAGPSFWIASRTDFDNVELGVGYRLSESSLAKLSYRADKWHLTDANRAFLGPGGHAVAVQFSQAFDLMSLLAHPE